MATEELTIEKRRFFRINDVVGLTYSIIGEAERQHATDSVNTDNPLADLIAEIDNEINHATNILWHENPTAAQALGLLNKKVAMITEHNLCEHNKDQNAFSCEELLVNISGCGMAFHSQEPLTTGARLKLLAQLKPSNIILRLTGSVIACEHALTDTTQGYWLRIDFDENNDVAQEQLIQHIVQRQCVQLQGNEPKSISS